MSERLLIRYPLFELLDAETLSALLAESVTINFETGEVLFQEGTTGAWVHMLLEGKVRILRRLGNGRDVSMGMVRAGELFGEYVLLKPHLHTASCRASSTCRVLRLPVRTVRETLSRAGIDGDRLKKLIRLHAAMHFLTGRHYLGFMSVSSALTYADVVRPETYRAMRTISGPQLAEDRWFMIQEGSVLISRRGTATELGPGDCFGSRALTENNSRVTVATLTEIKCLTLNSRAFLEGSQVSPVSDSKSSGLGEAGLNQQTLFSHNFFASRFPFRAQKDESDCGLAALAMVASFLERPIDDVIAGQKFDLPPDGLSLLQLRDLTRSLGLQANSFRVDPDHWQDVSCPFIAHLSSGHYVVVFQSGVHVVIIADPATCQHATTDDKFLELWSGYVLIVKANLE